MSRTKARNGIFGVLAKSEGADHVFWTRHAGLASLPSRSRTEASRHATPDPRIPTLRQRPVRQLVDRDHGFWE
jgi:hypothetical protein